MTDNFRRSIINRLPAMPPPMAPTKAPWAESADDDVEELDGEGEDGLGELGTGAGPSKIPTQDLSPLSASGFFDQALEIDPPGNDTAFRAYLTPAPPTKESKTGTYLVCHHGAGAGGLSFAALAKEIKMKSNGELGVLTYDCRGHGKTKTSGPRERDTDLSLKTLLSDLISIIQRLFPDPKEAPALLLLGHSMGAGPILSAAPELQKLGYTVPGVIVIDVVEGTAVEALPLMKTILSQRPSTFRSVVDGIHWQSQSIRSIESARVSVPSYLIPSPSVHDPSQNSKQIWRTDLLATEPYWEEWYAGLSSRFLSAKCARMLVLAGQERLDKELMVGQMQGKFQLEVLQDVGHYLHEDNPASLAGTLVTFWRRNTRVLILPPKIGSIGPASGVEVKRVGET